MCNYSNCRHDTLRELFNGNTPALEHRLMVSWPLHIWISSFIFSRLDSFPPKAGPYCIPSTVLWVEQLIKSKNYLEPK